MARRRLDGSRAGRPAVRRRRTRPLVGLARPRPERAQRRPGFARAYVALAAALVVAIAHVVVAAQTTQTSYELNRLKEQNAQLLADQDQLRFQQASLHTPARIEQAAAQAGLQRTGGPRYVAYQPVAIDVTASLAPDRPSDEPLWQRSLVALAGSVAHDVLAADGSR